MNPQKELFPESKIDISPEFYEMAKVHPTLCYNELREKGMPIGLSLWFVIERNLQTDFEKLFQEFEDTGKMIYLNLPINGIQFEIIEYDSMELEFNDKIIFTWDEEMTFDNDSISKIKAAIKNHCVNNQYQFTLK